MHPRALRRTQPLVSRPSSPTKISPVAFIQASMNSPAHTRFGKETWFAIFEEVVDAAQLSSTALTLLLVCKAWKASPFALLY
ncbi:hypothetical protein CALVIDRAFT_537316 [Calocera viscosa TUFC12733]|uniref:Uncharacterized protein n=1 Tax=Calocera viscosa (strain TUFC12733) TaxID=1330018 RepID=A0A167LX78_CALVF|nr:hypothetical protein CALVIDRAFT_537316 [Calocera viscosa TUFC12733]